MDTTGNNNLARMRNDEFVSNLVVPRSRTSLMSRNSGRSVSSGWYRFKEAKHHR
jgi:hypothetical protein